MGSNASCPSGLLDNFLCCIVRDVHKYRPTNVRRKSNAFVLRQDLVQNQAEHAFSQRLSRLVQSQWGRCPSAPTVLLARHMGVQNRADC